MNKKFKPSELLQFIAIHLPVVVGTTHVQLNNAYSSLLKYLDAIQDLDVKSLLEENQRLREEILVLKGELMLKRNDNGKTTRSVNSSRGNETP